MSSLDQNETAKNNLNEYLPQAKYANSKIISTDKVAHVISILPPRFSVQNIEMIYSTYKDGYSLTSGEITYQCSPSTKY